MDANMGGGPATSHAEDARPRVGVGAIVVRDGRVLVGRRTGDAHGAATWQFPGGHLEAGESPEQCAEREVREEAGLDVRAIARGPYTNDVFPETGRHYVTLFVVTTPRDPAAEPVVREPHKCAEWRWCAWDALPTPRFLPLAHLLAAGYRPPGASEGGVPTVGAPEGGGRAGRAPEDGTPTGDAGA